MFNVVGANHCKASQAQAMDLHAREKKLTIATLSHCYTKYFESLCDNATKSNL